MHWCSTADYNEKDAHAQLLFQSNSVQEEPKFKIEAMDRKKVTFSAECHLFRVYIPSHNDKPKLPPDFSTIMLLNNRLQC